MTIEEELKLVKLERDFLKARLIQVQSVINQALEHIRDAK